MYCSVPFIAWLVNVVGFKYGLVLRRLEDFFENGLIALGVLD